MELLSAIRAGDLAKTESLIRSASGVNDRDAEGFTPLMIAAGLGQPQMVELLLAAGADALLLEPRMGAAALHKAAQSGDAAVIVLLLENGAFVDLQSPILGHTALMDAVLHKQEGGVRTLLAYGARPGVRNHWGQTALDLAESDGLEAIARVIRDKVHADENLVRQCGLVIAAKAGDYEGVKRLISAGIDVDQRMPIIGTPDDDYTPVGIAAREGHTAIVDLLRQSGADIEQPVGLMKGTLYHEAAYFGHADVIEMLASTRSETPTPRVDAQGPYNGLTAIHDAVWHGHLNAVRSLIAAGARLDLESHAGLKPSQLALLYGYDDIASFLAESE
ncbi:MULTISPECIES: ankyrin repeat domain-containing protein [Rhizobium]|uniref:Ankyrin repeat protein n=1 Tax=Rhizobium esperanzae TaxID=1967781 RepID=A0A7W6UMW3_9HYPH|nr:MULTISPECIES: ankyrin repeat domain-containing protein [Rhizobium]MBB4439967.1 ankyrin repeat protein [Rhizobium esperanzae]MDH6202466.1 ankyrin repeat protein [Rhizobium leguminosarum]